VISQTAGECLKLVKGLQVVYGHRRPASITVEQHEEMISQLVAEIISCDHNGDTITLQKVHKILRDQWNCYTGEEIAVTMGLATIPAAGLLTSSSSDVVGSPQRGHTTDHACHSRPHGKHHMPRFVPTTSAWTPEMMPS